MRCVQQSTLEYRTITIALLSQRYFVLLSQAAQYRTVTTTKRLVAVGGVSQATLTRLGNKNVARSTLVCFPAHNDRVRLFCSRESCVEQVKYHVRMCLLRTSGRAVRD